MDRRYYGVNTMKTFCSSHSSRLAYDGVSAFISGTRSFGLMSLSLATRRYHFQVLVRPCRRATFDDDCLNTTCGASTMNDDASFLGPTQAVKVYCCYAERNRTDWNELSAHLAVLTRQGLIETRHNHDIPAGYHLSHECCHHLD